MLRRIILALGYAYFSPCFLTSFIERQLHMQHKFTVRIPHKIHNFGHFQINHLAHSFDMYIFDVSFKRCFFSQFVNNKTLHVYYFEIIFFIMALSAQLWLHFLTFYKNNKRSTRKKNHLILNLTFTCFHRDFMQQLK